MARSTARSQRQRIRQLEAALAATQAEASAAKSLASMANMPVPRTSREQVYPVYPSQVPTLEPWRMPQQYGAYNRGTPAVELRGRREL